jgi:hypothetical protein
MLKKIFMISLPFMLVACGMEYEGELADYSTLQDEAGIESVSGDYELTHADGEESRRVGSVGEEAGDDNFGPIEPQLPSCKADGYQDRDKWLPGCSIVCLPGERAKCRGASEGQQSICGCGI